MIQEYSLSVISLFKGVLYEQQRDAWENLLRYEAEVKKHVAVLALEVYIDKAEGYAFLRQKKMEEVMEIPRVVERRPLSFFPSLMCLILRKYLLEHDAESGSVRTIITGLEISSRIKAFLPTATDEVKQQDKINAMINKMVNEFGFLRKLDDEGNYEIHRIIKGFVNAEVIDETLQKLRGYATEKNISE